jgi:CRP/FNR family cyclic AMP-dependent transcriptional regulator
LCDRLRKTDEQLAEVALLQIPVRLAKVLLRMADDMEAGPRQKAYEIQLSQRELGNIVGATRESVNKCLRSWQTDGVVVVDKGLITITNRKSLEELVEQA